MYFTPSNSGLLNRKETLQFKAKHLHGLDVFARQSWGIKFWRHWITNVSSSWGTFICYGPSWIYVSYGSPCIQWGAKIQFMVLVLLMLQNVYWYIRNTDFSVILCWNFSLSFRPKTPPTTPRALFWPIISGGPKWKRLMFVLFRDYKNLKYTQA